MKSDAFIGRHLVFVVLCQGARLARRLETPLKDFQELAGAAYFFELRRESFTQQEAADHMGISLRKVASIAAKLRETFHQVEEKVGLPRRIEHLLWTAPASRSRIAQLLSGSDEKQLARAVEKLIREGRISEEEGARTPVLRVTRGEARLVSGDWISRLDGVENFMRNVGNTLGHRFFGNAEASMARTASLVVRARDLPKLRELYEQTIWPRLVELEKASVGADDLIDIDLSFLWAKSTEEEEKAK